MKTKCWNTVSSARIFIGLSPSKYKLNILLNSNSHESHILQISES